MKFPFIVIPELTDRQFERYYRHIDSDASGWHRRWTESIWRRHQHPSNAALSGWKSPDDRKRRLIHFYDEYGLEGRSFVLRGAYIWLNLDLPEEDVEAYLQLILEGLATGGWRRDGTEQGGRVFRRGDLVVRIAFARCHLQDEARRSERPDCYRNLDVTIRTEGYRVPNGWVERPWRVFFDVGLRKVLPRGRPTLIEPEALMEHLPAQLELGCGPSIEAGIPHLSTLHRIYGVSKGTYGFVFQAADDGLLDLFSSPEHKYREMTDIYRACILAESTGFYRATAALTKAGFFVGPVITNNFDCQCADIGLSEVSLRRYDWEPYYPTIDYDRRAQSLLVVGVHADRRLVQMRARARGLMVMFIDPEEYISPDWRRIDYPVEAPQDQDLFVRETATDALERLQRVVG